MKNEKIKVICPLTCTKCNMFCFRFDNCGYKNAATLNAINKSISKSNQKKGN